MTELDRKIRVLIVDDSQVALDILEHIFGADPRFEVVGTACDGKQAVRENARLKPDVITMDVMMPVMDGLDATRVIMQEQPIPIVVVSAMGKTDKVDLPFLALKAGAVATVSKPRGLLDSAHEADAKELRETVRLMSEIRVVRRRPPRIRTEEITNPEWTGTLGGGAPSASWPSGPPPGDPRCWRPSSRPSRRPSRRRLSSSSTSQRASSRGW